MPRAAVSRSGKSWCFTVDGVFEEFCARRTGLVRAFTADQRKLYRSCEPGDEDLRLYGKADGSWDVTPPEEMLPAKLPEPAVGINQRRDAMSRVDWLAEVAVHSDSWLIAVAAFHASYLDARGRMRLYDMISDLPTVHEVFIGYQTATSQLIHKESSHGKRALKFSTPKDPQVQHGQASTSCGVAHNARSDPPIAVSTVRSATRNRPLLMNTTNSGITIGGNKRNYISAFETYKPCTPQTAVTYSRAQNKTQKE